MKKLYSFGLILTAFMMNSQTDSLEVKCTSAGSVVVNNNQAFPVATTAGQIDKEFFFTVKNTSAASLTYTVRRYDDLLNTVSGSDFAEAYFCTGIDCYLPSVMNGTFALAAGANTDLIAKLNEASVVGPSTIRYKVSVNGGSSAEVIIIYLNYNAPASVRELSSYFASVSAVYPNPSVSRSFVDINAVKDLNNVSLTITNILGSVVSSKQIDLDKGKNKVAVDSENLESGVYFVSISMGTSKITKKITISK